MFALEYAENNFNYAYKGNYNNIFLYNDSKPKGFEVKENSQTTTNKAYIPVKINPDNDDHVIAVDYQWYNQVIDYFNPSFESNIPKAYSALMFNYLLDQDLAEKTGLIKIYQSGSETSVLPQEVYSYNNQYYVLDYIVSGTILDEVVISATAGPKPLKPFLDFDDQLDKSDNQLIVMVSSNGAKIDHAFMQTTQVNPNEIILYIEDQQGSNLFGSSVRVKSGSKYNGLPSQQVTIIANLLKKMDLSIDRSSIVQIIKKHFYDKKEGNDLVYYIKKGFFFGAKVVSVAANVPKQAINQALGLLIDGVEYLKFEDNRWKYYNKDGTKNQNFNGLIPIDNAVKQLDKTKDLINDISNKVDHYLDNITLGIDQVIQSLDKRVYSYFKNFNQYIFKALKTVRKAIAELLKTITQSAKDFLIFINALIIGLINSLLDTVLFILGIAKALFNPELDAQLTENLIFNPKASVSMFLEVIENGVDILVTFISKKVLGSIVTFFIKAYQLITSPDKAALDFKLPKTDQVGYFVGAIVGFIIEEVVGAMLTLGAFNIAKASQLVLKSMKTTLTSVVKAPVKMATTIAKVGKKGVIKIISLMDVIKDFIINLPKYLNALLEYLQKLLLQASKYVQEMFINYFPKASSRKVFKKLGVKPTHFEDGVFSFCPILT